MCRVPELTGKLGIVRRHGQAPVRRDNMLRLQELEELEVYGRKLKDIATISDCRLGDSTIIRIKTKAEVEGKVR